MIVCPRLSKRFSTYWTKMVQWKGEASSNLNEIDLFSVIFYYIFLLNLWELLQNLTGASPSLTKQKK